MTTKSLSDYPGTPAGSGTLAGLRHTAAPDAIEIKGRTTLELRGVQQRKDLVPRKADGKSGIEALCLGLYQIGPAKNTKPPKAELPLLGGTYMATISENTFPSLSRDHKERDHLLKSKKVWEDNGSYRVFVATSGREVTRSERRLVPSLPPCMNA